MENNSVKKKNNEILEELSLDLKCILEDTASIKKDIHYIKTIILMKDKVKQDQVKPQEEISTGWRLW